MQTHVCNSKSPTLLLIVALFVWLLPAGVAFTMAMSSPNLELVFAQSSPSLDSLVVSLALGEHRTHALGNPRAAGESVQTSATPDPNADDTYTVDATLSVDETDRSVRGQSPPPNRFAGNAFIDGEKAAEGTLIEALSDGNVVGTTTVLTRTVNINYFLT